MESRTARWSSLIAGSLHEARRFGAIDETGGAVVPQEQCLGDVVHGRCSRPGMTPDGEQQLVLSGSETLAARLLLAPADEAAQVGAEPQQELVVVVAEILIGHPK